MTYSLSGHAVLRKAQRNISDEEVEFILQCGYRMRRTGIIFCQMRRDCLPHDKSANRRQRLVGVTVLLCRCGEYIITIKRDDFKRDKRKTKRTCKQQISSCPHCGCTYPIEDDFTITGD